MAMKPVRIKTDGGEEMASSGGEVGGDGMPKAGIRLDFTKKPLAGNP